MVTGVQSSLEREVVWQGGDRARTAAVVDTMFWSRAAAFWGTRGRVLGGGKMGC